MEKEPSCGRSVSATTGENIKAVHDVMMDNLRITTLFIAQHLEISKERVEHITHCGLKMIRDCTMGTPRPQGGSETSASDIVTATSATIFGQGR